MDERAEMLAALKKYVEDVVIHSNVDSALTVVSDDVVGLGMGDQGIVRNRDELRKVLANDKRASGMTYSVRYGDMDVRFYPPSFGVICGVVNLDCHLDDNTISSSIIQFAGMRKEEGRWYICAVTAAPVVMTTESIDAYPLAFAESTLSQLKKELQTLTETIPGGVVTLSMDDGLSVMYANQSFREMYGGNVKHLTAVLHPEDRERVRGAIADACGKTGGFELETRTVRKEGQVLWATICGGFIQSANGLEAHCVMLDITARKHYEEQQKQHEQALREAAQAAEAATRTKSAFLANMSHEIRTPMNGVLGLAELALDDDTLSDHTREYLSKIRVSAEGLLNIINDILDVSKIEAGKFELDRLPFRLRDVLTHCDTVCRLAAQEKGIDFTIRADETARQRLLGDPTKLRQVLLNLLSNAIKFTNSGSVELTLAGKAAGPDDVAVSFEVKDTGIGMRGDQLGKILEPFAQADTSTTRRFGGTGLGLSIARSFVELMGGTLAVESQPDQGSRFSFTLPFSVARSDGGEGIDDASGSPARTGKPVFSGDVLVCEDNTINQQVIREHLSRIGLNATVAPNGKLAIEVVSSRLANGSCFDIILMDISMPVMDGLEATRIMRAMGVRTPIIAMTANALKSDRERYLQGGMNDYIGKPFVARELWDCLMRYLKPVEIRPRPDTVTVEAKMEAVEKSAALVDHAAGLTNAAGNPSLHKKVLRNFRRENADLMTGIRDAVAEGRWEDAQRMAHTMKGLARLIGAARLSDASLGAEIAMKEKAPADDARLTAMERELRAVLEELAKTAEPEESAPPEEKEAFVVDGEEAGEMLGELETLLHDGDDAGLRFLEENFWILAPLGEVCAVLLDQVEKKDRGAALATVEAIRSRIRGS